MSANNGDTDRQMGFADAGRSQQDNILGAGSESQSSRFVDLSLVNGRLKAEVEFLQTLSVRETGQLCPHFLAISSALLLLGGQKIVQKLRIGVFRT
jgi:hypothetical protein